MSVEEIDALCRVLYKGPLYARASDERKNVRYGKDPDHQGMLLRLVLRAKVDGEETFVLAKVEFVPVDEIESLDVAATLKTMEAELEAKWTQTEEQGFIEKMPWTDKDGHTHIPRPIAFTTLERVP